MGKILITDDERMVRNLLAAMFAKMGHYVETAFNGSEVLRMFAEGRFDLVTTDYNMPVMDGHILARRIKQKSPHTPVILITGYAPDIKSEHIDLTLQKPCGFQILRDATNRFLHPGFLNQKKEQVGAISVNDNSNIMDIIA